jgi:hypothetical protein
MTVRALDENGDIKTSGVQFISGQDEIAQTITTRLKLFSGEYFRNITDGTPWFDIILPKNTSLSLKDSFIKSRIAETNGVRGLLSYSSNYDIDLRKYSVSSEVLTEFGVLQINQNGIE